MAYASVAAGTATGLTDLNIAQWTITQRVFNRDVSNGATATVMTEHETGRYHFGLSGSSFFYTGSAYPKPIEVTVSNSLYGCINRVQLNVSQFLENATCASTPQGQAKWIKGKFTYSGTAYGFIETDETPLSDGTISLSNFTIPFSTTHSISGNAKLRRASMRNNAQTGGCIGTPYSFVFTGNVTFTGTGNFLGSGTTPVKEYTTAITLDNGEEWDGTAVVRSIGVIVDYRTGLPTIANFDLPFDGAVIAESSGA